ncbi:MAG: DnaA/Hda family protein [Tetragenococcus halophilus]|nr:DnaA/Hda family protein [Tetragenococcus halophilus]
MKNVSMAEQMRNKMTYTTDEQCEVCGNYLTAWRKEERGKPFCEQCKAKGMKEQEEEQQREWTRNAYQAKAIHRLKGSSLLKDKEVWNYTLDDYKGMDAETRQALDLARRAVWDTNEGKTLHFFFSGAAGVVKTTLSVGILKKVLEADVNKKCVFIDYQYLLEETMRSFNDDYLKKSINKIMNDIYKADLVIIDDIGSETSTAENKRQKASDFTVKQLNSILQARANKSTIITTNLTGQQIKQAYGERIISRIFAHSQGYTMAFKETKDKRMHPIIID